MTPKEQYEARKAARLEEMRRREEHWAKVSQLDAVIREKTSILELLKMADRFVTAIERIADAMERPQSASFPIEPLRSEASLTMRG